MATYELVEENSESCPIEGVKTGGAGFPLWLLAIVGVTMIVGIVVVSGDDKKGGVK